MATVQYDDILLNIGSRASTDGIDKSISMLKQLKEIFPISGIKESADAMKEFASAINSMDKGVVTALASIKGNLGSVAKEAKKTTAEIAKAQKTASNTIGSASNGKYNPRNHQGRMSQQDIDVFGGIQDRYTPNFDERMRDAGQELANAMKDYEANLKRAKAQADALANSENSVADNAKKFQQDYQKALETLRDVPTTDKTYMTKRMGLDPAAVDEARQAVKAAKEEQRKYNEAVREAERLAKAQAKEEAERAKAIAKAAKEAEKAKTPLQKFADRLKKILEYRILRSAITGIANAIKGGITNMEQWSRKTGANDLYKSIDTARSAWEVLKNSLAVVIAPGLEWLIGVFERIARAIMMAANWLSRFFAILGGRSSYTTVKWADYSAKATDDYGHSLKKASDDAKEFKKQLMGFDEINNITESKGSDGSGSGGSGTGGGFNFKDMFEEVKLEDLSPFESYMKKVGEKWREGWQDLKDRASASWKHIKRGWKNFCTIIGAIWTSISTKAKDDWQHLVNFVKLIWNGTITWFKNAGEEWKEGWAELTENMKTAWDKICKFVKDAWTAVKIVFLTVYMVIKDTFDKLKAIVKSIIDGIVARFEYLGTVTQNVMDLIAGKKTWDQFKQDMKTASQTLDNTLTKSVDELNRELHKTFDTTWHLDANGKLILNEVDVSGLGSSYFKITKYANGGMPNMGSLFIAGESGPEMVGTIGGSTAVANNDDIVAAVSQGVASAVASVLGNGTNVNVVLEGDARNLFRVVQNQARNYAIQTGSYAFG